MYMYVGNVNELVEIHVATSVRSKKIFPSEEIVIPTNEL